MGLIYDVTELGLKQVSKTEVERDAIVSPDEGLSIYNSTNKSIDFYDGTSWLSLNTGGGSDGNGIYTGSGSLSAATTVTNAGFDLSITGTGNFGIGTSTPLEKLDVTESFAGLGGVKIKNTDAGANSYSGIKFENDAAGLKSYISLNSTTNTSFAGANSFNISTQGTGGFAINTKDNSGNAYFQINQTTGHVGIDSASSEGAMLALGTGLGDKLFLYDTADPYGFGVTAAQGLQHFAGDVNGQITWGYGKSATFTERMRLNSTGLGIGTSTPTEKLEVVGNAKINGNNLLESSSSYIQEIYKTTNSGSFGIDFHAKNSVNVKTRYGGILANIENNADGSEEGSIRFALSEAGAVSSSEHFKFRINGLIETKNSGSGGTFRDLNTVGASSGWNYSMRDSANNIQPYGFLSAKIEDNTSGSEDASMVMGLAKNGNPDSNGIFEFYKESIIRGTSTGIGVYNDVASVNGTNTAFSFWANNSIEARHPFASIYSKVLDNTSTSEDADLRFNVIQNGTLDSEGHNMVLTGTGLGIGTNTPTEKLEVVGNTYVNGLIGCNVSPIAGQALTINSTGSSTEKALQIRTNAGTERFFIQGDGKSELTGRLGINDTTVQGAQNYMIWAKQDVSASKLFGLADNAGNLKMEMSSVGRLTLNSNDALTQAGFGVNSAFSTTVGILGKTGNIYALKVGVGANVNKLNVKGNNDNYGVGVMVDGTDATNLKIGASTTTHSSINFVNGAAPTSPNNGDFWFDGTDLFIRVSGTTYTLTKT